MLIKKRSGAPPPPPPQFLVCYLCAGEFGSRSLPHHASACFHKRVDAWERAAPGLEEDGAGGTREAYDYRGPCPPDPFLARVLVAQGTQQGLAGRRRRRRGGGGGGVGGCLHALHADVPVGEVGRPAEERSGGDGDGAAAEAEEDTPLEAWNKCQRAAFEALLSMCSGCGRTFGCDALRRHAAGCRAFDRGVSCAAARRAAAVREEAAAVDGRRTDRQADERYLQRQAQYRRQARATIAMESMNALAVAANSSSTSSNSNSGTPAGGAHYAVTAAAGRRSSCDEEGGRARISRGSGPSDEGVKEGPVEEQARPGESESSDTPPRGTAAGDGEGVDGGGDGVAWACCEEGEAEVGAGSRDAWPLLVPSSATPPFEAPGLPAGGGQGEGVAEEAGLRRLGNSGVFVGQEGALQEEEEVANAGGWERQVASVRQGEPALSGLEVAEDAGVVRAPTGGSGGGQTKPKIEGGVEEGEGESKEEAIVPQPRRGGGIPEGSCASDEEAAAASGVSAEEVEEDGSAEAVEFEVATAAVAPVASSSGGPDVRAECPQQAQQNTGWGAGVDARAEGDAAAEAAAGAAAQRAQEEEASAEERAPAVRWDAQHPPVASPTPRLLCQPHEDGEGGASSAVPRGILKRPPPPSPPPPAPAAGVAVSAAAATPAVSPHLFCPQCGAPSSHPAIRSEPAGRFCSECGHCFASPSDDQSPPPPPPPSRECEWCSRIVAAGAAGDEHVASCRAAQYAARGQAAPPPPMSSEEAEAEGDRPRAACEWCGRSFYAERLEKHTAVCKAQACNKAARSVFDARGQRRAEGAGVVAAKRQDGGGGGGGTTNWRAKTGALRAALAAAKGGGGGADAPVTYTTEEHDGRTPCPNCGRRFAAAVAERHIPACAAQKSRPRPRQAGRKANYADDPVSHNEEEQRLQDAVTAKRRAAEEAIAATKRRIRRMVQRKTSRDAPWKPDGAGPPTRAVEYASRWQPPQQQQQPPGGVPAPSPAERLPCSLCAYRAVNVQSLESHHRRVHNCTAPPPLPAPTTSLEERVAALEGMLKMQPPQLPPQLPPQVQVQAEPQALQTLAQSEAELLATADIRSAIDDASSRLSVLQAALAEKARRRERAAAEAAAAATLPQASPLPLPVSAAAPGKPSSSPVVPLSTADPTQVPPVQRTAPRDMRSARQTQSPPPRDKVASPSAVVPLVPAQRKPGADGAGSGCRSPVVQPRGAAAEQRKQLSRAAAAAAGVSVPATPPQEEAEPFPHGGGIAFKAFKDGLVPCVGCGRRFGHAAASRHARHCTGVRAGAEKPAE